MRSLRLAEWILLLVMPGERAAAVVGDLAESSSGRIKRWTSELSTFFASLFREILDSPADMVRAVKDFVATTAYLSARCALRFLFPVVIIYMAILIWPPIAPAGALAALFVARVMICPGRQLAAGERIAVKTLLSSYERAHLRSAGCVA